MGDSLDAALNDFYALERNLEISSFWDSGWVVRFGDPTNGFTDTFYCDTAEEIAAIVRAAIAK